MTPMKTCPANAMKVSEMASPKLTSKVRRSFKSNGTSPSHALPAPKMKKP